MLNKGTKIKVILVGIVFVLVNISCSKKNMELVSPDGNYVFRLGTNADTKKTTYEVEFDGKTIIEPSALGFNLKEYGEIGKELQIVNVQYNNVDTVWKPVYGEKSEYPEKYSQAIIQFKHKASGVPNFNLNVRAYNEGVAFMYEFENDRKIEISSELTEFALATGTEVWVSDKAQHPIYKSIVAKLDSIVDRPVMAELINKLYVSVGEAALVDFARMKLSRSSQNSNALLANLSGEVIMEGSFYTPWRTIMAGHSPTEILENNYLLLNLNEPNKIANTEWIKPGKVIREVTLTTTGAKACIDFAERHNLQYVEFDAGWYGPEHDLSSDASTVTVDPKRSKGPLDLPWVINYADKKNIGIILYVNHRAMEKQLDQILPLYQSWGIKGLKYGFVNVGSQYWTSWLHEAVRKAAKYELMVDVHDEYRPTGYSRTYPNLMTQEGIRGDETSPSTAHTLKTLFTRMLAGAGDNTNCYLAPRISEKMGGKTGQMAKAVMIYSPWQFLYWYDRPEGSPVKKGGAGGAETILKESEALKFYDALPTVWDDTKVLDGKIGEYATVVRQSGDEWFLGTLVANEPRTIDISLDFLDSGSNYEACIFYQREQELANNKVGIQKMAVTADSVLSRQLMKNSGLAAIFRKK